MPEFHYIALARDGSETQGTESAPSVEELKRRLRRRRLIMVKSREIRVRPVHPRVTARIVGELADLLDGGVNLEYALKVVAADSSDRRVSSLAGRLRDELKAGRSLSQALAALGRFDSLLIPLVYAGEVSGELPATMNALSRYFGERRQLRSDIVATLAYPAVLVVVSLLSLVGLTVYIVPIFRDVFEDDLARLPATTRFTFDVSEWLASYGLWAAGGAALAALAGGLAIRHVPGARLRLHRTLLRLPVAGPLTAMGTTGRLLTVLAMLLRGGVPLAQAMEIARGTVGNLALREGMDRAVQALRRGGSIGQVIDYLPALPSVARRMITVGDESGRLAASAEKAAGILQRDLRERLKTLVSLIEPTVILLMGGMVGFVVVSMLLAVFSLSDLAG